MEEVVDTAAMVVVVDTVEVVAAAEVSFEEVLYPRSIS